ncbi:MAG: hypothetical protein K2Q06_16820, partial [Parvularculaceae bacterium]|nr:hypothetical protein [Parvularculaceae bacterium]
HESYAARNWSYDRLGAVPAAYVVCLRDACLPVSWQEKFARRLRARIVRLDAGHQAMTTRPHALAEILLKEAAA